MVLLSSVAMVLVSVAAYSAGWTLAAGGRRHAPGLFDLGLVLALWIAAFALRPELGRWPTLAAAVATAGALGAARVTLTRRPLAEPHAGREAPMSR